MGHDVDGTGEADLAYRASCEVCGELHHLPRTEAAIEAAHDLKRRLERDPRFGREGKMFGVLLGTGPRGEPARLEAFSGMLEGEPYASGFVGPTRSRRLTAQAERETLTALRELGQQIESIDVASAENAFRETKRNFDEEISKLVAQRLEEKARRSIARAATASAAERRNLEAISQREGGRIRALRGDRREALEPVARELAARRSKRAALRNERRSRSRALQAAMHESHGLLNFAGRFARLDEFFTGGIPTGTGECCAPKLLQEAALRGIRPTSVAEFWWGPPPSGGGRDHTCFYPPCKEKCGPILGHLLCGLDAPRPPIAILYEDDDLLVVDKPAGLLSVPGRTGDQADCVETRLSLLRPGAFVRAAHRLDQATSGVLLLARTREAYRRLGAAFADREIEKEYRTWVAGPVLPDEGEIRLPLGPDLAHRPRQTIDHGGGRDAITRFSVLSRTETTTELRLMPLTGRTHQLRVHCASPAGLAAPIVGDPLYGEAAGRMLLHAHRVVVMHPRTGIRMTFCAPLPADFV